MIQEQKHVSYAHCGSLYSTYSGCIVNSPAILVNMEDDIIHKWGNINNLEPIFERYYHSVAAVEGQEAAQKNVKLINLCNLTAEQQSYVINRMMEYTASGFVREFTERALNDIDCLSWLDEEMISFPYPIK